MTDIKELKDGTKQANVSGIIVRKEAERTVNLRAGGTSRVAKAVLKDSSGEIALVLWNEQIERVNENSLVSVEKGYVSNWKGELQLNIGRYGTLKVDGN